MRILKKISTLILVELDKGELVPIGGIKGEASKDGYYLIQTSPPFLYEYEKDLIRAVRRFQSLKEGGSTFFLSEPIIF